MARSKRTSEELLIADEHIDQPAKYSIRWAKIAAIAGGAALALSPVGGAIVHAANSSAGFGDLYDDDIAVNKADFPMDDWWYVAYDDKGGSDKGDKDKKKKGDRDDDKSPGGGNNGHNQGVSNQVGEDDDSAKASGEGNNGHNKNNGNVQGGQQVKDNDEDRKIGICHATGSASNPFVFIVVDKHAVKAHENHQEGRDIIGANSSDDCPTGSVGGTVQDNDKDADSVSISGSVSGGGSASASGSAGSQGSITGGDQPLQQNTGNDGGQQVNIVQPQQPGGVGGVIGFAPLEQPLQPQQAEQIANVIGGGLTSQDILVMTPGEVAGALEARGFDPIDFGVGGVVGFADQWPIMGVDGVVGFADQGPAMGAAPLALPAAGGLPIPASEVIGLGALLAGAGALLRRSLWR